MKAKLLNLVIKLKCDEDLDEQDILDQFAGRHLHAPEYQAGNSIEFVDAEIRETLTDAFQVNIAAIVDDLNNIYSELLEDKRNNVEDKAFYRGALDILKAFKNKLTDPVESKQYCLDQIHGENVVQSMRLTKAELLLTETLKYVCKYSQIDCDLEMFQKIDDIDQFLKESPPYLITLDNGASIAVGQSANPIRGADTTGANIEIESALVAYDPKSGNETARTALENVLHKLDKLVQIIRGGSKNAELQVVRNDIMAELNKLEEK